MATLPTEKKYAAKMDRTYTDIAADIGRAAAQGMTLGFSDELYGLFAEYMLGKDYDEAVAEVREGLERFRESDPVKAYGFEILGGMLAGGGVAGVARGAGMAATRGTGIKLGAGEAATYGAGTGETAGERVVGAITGAPIGAGGTYIGQAITPKVTEIGKKMLDQGYRLTPGQAFGGTTKRIEEGISLPGIQQVIQQAQARPVGQFRRKAVEDAVAGLDINIPRNLDGEALVEFVEEAIGDAYQSIVPKLSITAKPVSDGIEAIVNKRVADGVFSEADAKEFRKLIAEVFTRNVIKGQLSKEMLKDAESSMSAEVRGLMKGSATDRRLARALKEAQALFRNEINIQNPQVPDLQPVNRAFARMRPIVKAKDAAVGKGGEFTPVQLLRQFRSAGVPVADQEAARQARDLLTVGIGSSGTAERFLTRPGASALGIGLGVLAEPFYSTGIGQSAARGLFRLPGRIVEGAAPVGGVMAAPEVADFGAGLLGVGEARAEPRDPPVYTYEQGVDRLGNPYTIAVDQYGTATRVR